MQTEPQPSRYETTFAFLADCAPELSAALSYTEVTNNRYCADVEVQNTGAAAAESWTVVLELLDSRYIAASGVDADFSTNGALLTATSLDASSPLLPGEGTSFHFCARKAAPSPAAEIASVSGP